ncbi:MAG: hypothetical protein ACK5QT_08085, partial [Oligoflexia bacterium]
VHGLPKELSLTELKKFQKERRQKMNPQERKQVISEWFGNSEDPQFGYESIEGSPNRDALLKMLFLLGK